MTGAAKWWAIAGVVLAIIAAFGGTYQLGKSNATVVCDNQLLKDQLAAAQREVERLKRAAADTAETAATLESGAALIEDAYRDLETRVAQRDAREAAERESAGVDVAPVCPEPTAPAERPNTGAAAPPAQRNKPARPRSPARPAAQPRDHRVTDDDIDILRRLGPD